MVTPEQYVKNDERQQLQGVFIVNFDQISCLSKELRTGL